MYQLGNGTGLSALMPYDRNTGKGMLCKVSGRLVSKSQVIVSGFSGELKAKPDHNDENNSLLIEQKPSVTFNLIMVYDTLLATNIELVNNELVGNHAEPHQA